MITRFIAIAVLLLLPIHNLRAETDTAAYLEAVRTFADNVLRYGRDTYGPRHTPLLIDGMNVDTHEPATWVLPEDCAEVWRMPRRSVMSNLASQQNLFRLLNALTTVTGDPRYANAATDATRYGLEHLQYKDGLLFWGGHCFVDLNTEQFVGESHKDWSKGVPIPAFWETGVIHELKHHYPYYELMWQIDPESTRRFVEGFWSAHIQNWANLDMNRHGVYGQDAGRGWKQEYVGGPLPFTGKGLSIMHGGSDLMYAAGMLTLLSGDERPLAWARRMLQRYADIRHPVTKLGPDGYNYYRNERLLAQFGPEWGDRINEMTIVSIFGSRYGQGALGLLKLAERLGPPGDIFRHHVIEDLTAYAKLAYDPSDNSFWAMLTDGTRLSPDVVKRAGSLAPDHFRKRRAGSIHLWAFSLAAQASREAALCQIARQIGTALRLGDIGNLAALDAQPPRLNLQTTCSDAYAVFALLDLNKLTGRSEYFDLAERIGNNLLRTQFHKGFFVASPNHLFSRFDTITPLALLYLHVAAKGEATDLPFYPGGNPFFHCDYEGRGRTYDSVEIYSQVRAGASQPAAAREIDD